jgi:hypothetical protein
MKRGAGKSKTPHKTQNSVTYWFHSINKASLRPGSPFFQKSKSTKIHPSSKAQKRKPESP